MGVIDRILGFFDYASYTSAKPPDASYREWFDGFTTEMDSTAAACIRVIVTMLASLDLRAVDRTSYEVIEPSAENSGAYFNRIMSRTTNAGSSFDFKARLFTDALLYGNAFVYPVKTNVPRNGRTVERLDDLIIIEPERVSVSSDDDDGSLRYKIGEGRVLRQDQLLHFKYPSANSLDRRLGAPPLSRVSNLMQLGQLASERVLANIKNGKTPLAVVLDSAATSQEARDQFQARMQAEWKMPWRYFATGTEVKMVDFTAQDAPMKELRMQTREEIAMAYGVPGPLVGIETTQWGQGIEQLTRLFWRSSLRPLAVAFEQQFNRLVQFRYRILFDELDILRGDWDAATKLIKGMLGPQGVAASPNEARRIALKLPPRPGGEEIQRPMQQVTIGTGAEDDDDESQEA